MDTIIFDIDGTLADATHRLHHVTGERKNYDKFFDEMIYDGVYEDVVHVLDMFLDIGQRVVLCSGRPDSHRTQTLEWLHDNGIIGWQALYMRTAGDYRADHVVKKELLGLMRADGYRPWLTIDDRPTIVKMWRAEGLTCLQCREWDEKPRIKPGLLVLMVGPSGAGKSTFLVKHLHDDLRNVVSSDQIRETLCGDFQDQSRNDDVFVALHAVVKARVESGLLTFVDATNIRNKDRKAIVDLAKGAKVHYYVMNRSMEDKYRDAGWRAELDFDLIAKHEQTFNSNLKDILNGDGYPNVTVYDLRSTA